MARRGGGVVVGGARARAPVYAEDDVEALEQKEYKSRYWITCLAWAGGTAVVCVYLLCLSFYLYLCVVWFFVRAVLCRSYLACAVLCVRLPGLFEAVQ